MIEVDIFPTKICLFDYADQSNLKNIFVSKYRETKHNEVGEQYGQNRVHLESEFQDFYGFVTSSVFQYLTSMGLNTNNFYVVVGKSWMSFVNENNGVPKHNHSDHHLSFTYYVDVPDGSCNVICFSDNRTNLNEPFYGAFNPNMGEPPNLVAFNKHNCLDYTLKIKEGQLCIFPSKLDHYVPSGDYKKERRCIAGDILLVYKNVNNKNPWGLYPPENWKYYETKMD